MPKDAIQPEAFLAHLPLFAPLDPEERARIAGRVTAIDVSRGTFVFQRGDACVGFHAIVYGQIALLLRAPGGGSKVVEMLGPRQSFGEAVMFMEKPYVVDAQALVDTKLLFIPRDALFAALDADPRLARRLLASLSARLHRLMHDVEAYSLHNGRERVIGYLLSCLPEEEQSESSELSLPTRKALIASRLNLTQEHFSRILHELAAAGLITVDGRRIAIPEVARLRSHGAPTARAE
jgi:CRP/FNR family transcriptional regulator, dissimilatory nitrate respiration regulator